MLEIAALLAVPGIALLLAAVARLEAAIEKDLGELSPSLRLNQASVPVVSTPVAAAQRVAAQRAAAAEQAGATAQSAATQLARLDVPVVAAERERPERVPQGSGALSVQPSAGA